MRSLLRLRSIAIAMFKHKAVSSSVLSIGLLALALTPLAVLTAKQFPALADDDGKVTQYFSIRLCNESSYDRIDLVVSFWDMTSSGWRAMGWIPVARGPCLSLPVGRSPGGYIYVYGKSGNSIWEGSSASFCINKGGNRFDIIYSDRINCRGANLARVGMYGVPVSPGSSFTFR